MVIIIAEAHTLDRTWMGRYLSDLLHFWVFPDLDGTRFFSFTNTSEECPAVSKHLKLWDLVTSLWSFFMIVGIPYFTITTCHNSSILGPWHVRETEDVCASSFEVIVFAPWKFDSLHLKVVERCQALVATVSETWIIIKPFNVHDFTIVAFALHVDWAVDCIEIIDICIGADSDSKHVATVTKSDLAAILHWFTVVLMNWVGVHIHHHDFVSNWCQDMESTWMEGYGGCLSAKLSLKGHFEFFFVPVPDANVTSWASYNKLLSKADIHSCDFLVMEGSMHILTTPIEQL